MPHDRRHPRYVSTLEDLKRGADLQFLCGINRIVGHGYAYSPKEAGSPGWGYYASVMMNDVNPWWPHFHLLADYLRRVSYAVLGNGIRLKMLADHGRDAKEGEEPGAALPLSNAGN